MSDTLKKLEELTLKLPHIHSVPQMAMYKHDRQPAFGISLYNDSTYAVQRCYMPKGFRFDDHVHQETEILVVISGAIKMVLHSDEGTQDVVIQETETFRFPPMTKHNAEALEDTWVVGITIPASESYP